MATYMPPRGRRGGLAITNASRAAAAFAASAPQTAPGGLSTAFARVRWTLIYAAFAAFAGAVISARFAVGQPLVILGIIGLLFQQQRLRWGIVTPMLALWTAWCALGLIGSEYGSKVYEEGVLPLIKLVVITLVGANAVRTRAQLRAFSIFAIFAFLIYPGRGTFLNYLTGASLSFGGRAIWNGIYSNPNDLAAIVLLLLAVAAGLAVGERSKRNKLAALWVCGFLAFIIFITQSRGALVGLGVFAVAVLWRAPKRQRARAGLAVLAIGAVMVVFAPSSVWDRLSGLRFAADTENLQQVDAEGSATQRFEIWKVATTIIAEHPLMGVGVGAYGPEHARVAMRPDFKWIARGARDTHSTYLNVMAETGVPGFLLFMAVVVATFAYAERARRRHGDYDPTTAQQLLLLEVGLTAYLVAGVWGSFARINMLYIFLVLLWCTARALNDDAPRLRAAAAGHRP